jgi:hypothetical protein
MSTLASVWIVYSLVSGTLYPMKDMGEFKTSIECEEYLTRILTAQTLQQFVCWPKIEEVE